MSVLRSLWNHPAVRAAVIALIGAVAQWLTEFLDLIGSPPV